MLFSRRVVCNNVIHGGLASHQQRHPGVNMSLTCFPYWSRKECSSSVKEESLKIGYDKFESLKVPEFKHQLLHMDIWTMVQRKKFKWCLLLYWCDKETRYVGAGSLTICGSGRTRHKFWLPNIDTSQHYMVIYCHNHQWSQKDVFVAVFFWNFHPTIDWQRRGWGMMLSSCPIF